MAANERREEGDSRGGGRDVERQAEEQEQGLEKEQEQKQGQGQEQEQDEVGKSVLGECLEEILGGLSELDMKLDEFLGRHPVSNEEQEIKNNGSQQMSEDDKVKLK